MKSVGHVLINAIFFVQIYEIELFSDDLPEHLILLETAKNVFGETFLILFSATT